MRYGIIHEAEAREQYTKKIKESDPEATGNAIRSLCGPSGIGSNNSHFVKCYITGLLARSFPRWAGAHSC